jgi:hypothetical protein
MNALSERPFNVAAERVAPPQPQRAIPSAINELERAQSRLTGTVSELIKRVQPVLRIEPCKGAEGNPPQGSTGCDIADRIISEVSAIDRATQAIGDIINMLEV